MTDWIGDCFTSDVGWNHLERLVDVGDRMAGSPGEREALEATHEALDAAGARDVSIDSFEIQGWERGDSAVRAGETTQDCIALPRSPAASVDGDLVDLGYGLPEDFEETDVGDRIVVVSSSVPDHYHRGVHRREKYYHAVENGAAGFVFANNAAGGLPITGSVGTADAPIGDIPAVGVSKEVGDRLTRRFAGETVTVEVDCETPRATSGNVHAELGPDTDDELLVTGHVDAHDISEGATDNGTGTATVVELARTLAAREDELETKVRLVCFGSEEVGLVGSSHESERCDRERVKAVVNVDCTVRGRTLQFDTHGFDALEDAAETVADRFGHPISTNPKLVPHSDHWPFVRWGVPGYMVSAETETKDRGWAHTAADTLDKLEKRTFREQAILLTELVVELAGDDVETAHRSPEEMASTLEAEDLAEGMKITGDWPY
ncbi:Zn-dependent amino-or carboxypeptidase, M28 family [Halogranum amylolyticum]|uniref:Carboxypeptidase Q n=1 Tax=Halogranum amylolyticum TaxID=660520 RepID=A0A1H8PC51_9EURY|nr:M28 family metallopeptidase [Halogranum amylolyticum]SEO39357.1 Zn-dependent amino-or carboxypeptidase, M28 family [Halogranum amylolyticum]